MQSENRYRGRITSIGFTNSAYRVQASCMATGQAAGMAAALAAEEKISVRDVSSDKLKHKLSSAGAIVPGLA
ncbi:FAD-dependent oxidoreductase [Paenibacillus sp. J5C_2022]|nr:FAD-dependent oxidoreductase [Paenibacillus sp. J5C2022]